jgi:hypothetical protein
MATILKEPSGTQKRKILDHILTDDMAKEHIVRDWLDGMREVSRGPMSICHIF